MYTGPFLTIEIKTPASTKNELLLHSNNIAYGYKGLKGWQIGGFGESDTTCEINVVCPLGSGWEAERNSVASGLSDDGANFFSGALVMNTCGSNRPFFLTADHVYKLPHVQNVGLWRFTFQAWSSTCPNPGTNNAGLTFNGSSLRANWSGSDFCLVELNTTPPANSGIRYAGWNRSATGITQTTILHHPKGDVMKITRYNGVPASATYNAAQCWRLVISTGNGATEGGSSGGPYFDQNRRIIGQHAGVPAGDLTKPVCQQATKFGGRFDKSWTGNNSSTTRLSNWLDPVGSGAFTTNTTNVANLSSPTPTLTVSGASIFR